MLEIGEISKKNSSESFRGNKPSGQVKYQKLWRNE